jgi:hypothetical protein
VREEWEEEGEWGWMMGYRMDGDGSVIGTGVRWRGGRMMGGRSEEWEEEGGWGWMMGERYRMA